MHAALKRFYENIDSIVITPAKCCSLNYLPFSNQTKKTDCDSISVSLVLQFSTVCELQREDLIFLGKKLAEVESEVEVKY